MNVSTITVSLPWWADAYAYTCRAFAMLHGIEPDADKIIETISKHIKVEVL